MSCTEILHVPIMYSTCPHEGVFYEYAQMKCNIASTAGSTVVVLFDVFHCLSKDLIFNLFSHFVKQISLFSFI